MPPRQPDRIPLDRLGAALFSLRRRSGLSRPDLAAESGFTGEQLCRYELGRIRPSLENLCRLLAALGADLSDLQRELDQPSGQPLAPSGWALVSNETAAGFAEQLRAQGREVYAWPEGGKVKVVWKERRQTAA